MMNQKHNRTIRPKRSQRGAILPIVTLLLPALLSMMALTVDIGYLHFVKRRMQNAADAGAVAAGYELKRNSSDNVLTAAARHDAGLNGFDGSHGETVTVNHPPASGSKAGNSSFAEVVISQDVPTFFMRVISPNAVQVQARAVAGTFPDPGLACIFVLDPTALAAFGASGSTIINSQCGIVVNSNHTRAMVISGSASITASTIDVTGNYSTSGSAFFTPTPTTGVSPTADPLAALSPPTFSGCNFTNKSISGSTAATLTPGVYCGGISISGSTGLITFQPGVYILNGGGLQISGSRPIQAQGVGFYNTFDASHSFDSINFSGSGVLNFSAPASGAMKGMLFFQNRSASTSESNSISGSTGSTFEGTIYFPTQSLTYTGSGLSVGAPWTIIIVRLLTFSGSTKVDNNYAGGYSAPPITRMAMAE
jgi:hypothetical protein